VFISAHDDEGYAKKARSLGAVAFLSKPCDEKSLVEAINKAIATMDTPGKNGIH
jgi:YesN/AraC family two-component response regulator